MQGVLHWVGQPRPGQEPPRFEARLYDRLFSTQTPGSKKKKAEDGQEPAATAETGLLWSIPCSCCLIQHGHIVTVCTVISMPAHDIPWLYDKQRTGSYKTCSQCNHRCDGTDPRLSRVTLHCMTCRRSGTGGGGRGGREGWRRLVE